MNLRNYVLMPVYNDWQCLPLLLKEIDLSFQSINMSTSICIIDDHSTRPSASILTDALFQRFHNIEQIIHVRLSRNVGHQSAIATGLHYLSERSDCSSIVIMDADGEDKPSDIPRLLSQSLLAQEPQIVFAGRRHRQEGLRFRLFYGLYKCLLYLLTSHWIDFGNFSVVPTDSLRALTLYNELWRHYPATVIRAKVPYRVVPCDRGRRYSGKSHMALPSLIVHGLQSISLFSHNIAARMLLVCSTLLIFPCLGIFVVVLVRLFTDLAIPGWATYVTGIMLVLILQLLAMVLLFAFLILTTPSPSILQGSSVYKTLIESVQIIGCKNDSNMLSRYRA